MPSTQIAQTGSLEQVLRTMALLAQSSAYAGALAVLVNNMKPGPTLGNFFDVTGAPFTLDISDTEAGGPAQWLGKQDAATPPGFAEVVVTDGIRLLPPYPALQLVGQPGKPMMGIGGLAEDRGFRLWTYTVDAIAVHHVDGNAQAAQRAAMVMIDAYEMLVERNESLAGLVMMITAAGPPQATSRPDPKGGFAGFAAVRFDVKVKRASGL